MHKIASLWAPAFLIAFITFAIYLPALRNGFVNWDDDLYIYENQKIQTIDVIFFKWIFTAVVAALWHPLTLFSYAVDYAIWGLNPLGYHLTNIFFHTANTFMVFVLVIHLIKCSSHNKLNSFMPLFHKERSKEYSPLIAGALIAFLFGIHPLRVESVVWISERKDVLCAFFFLSSIFLYLKYASSFSSKRHLFYAASLISFILSLLSKPMAVSLPVVLLILDFYPLNRFTNGLKGIKVIKVILIEKLPFFLLSIIISLITIWASNVGAALEGLETLPLLTRFLVAARTSIFYLLKMVLPLNLAPIYPYPIKIDSFAIEYFGSVSLLIIITILCLWLLRKGRLFMAIWLYYIATLAPVIGIVQVGIQSAADRYTYLPSLGPFLLAGLGVAAVFERCSKKTMQVLMVVALFLALSTLGIRTVKQVAIWNDSITLWSHEIKLYPGKVLAAYNNRGKAYGGLGNYHEAIKDYNKVIELNPKYADGYHARGNIYLKLGNYQQAVGDYTFAIQLKTKYYKEAYSNRGIANYNIGDHQQAINDFNNAIMLDPQDKTAYDNREIVYQKIGHK